MGRRIGENPCSRNHFFASKVSAAHAPGATFANSIERMRELVLVRYTHGMARVE
jgi:hypothetical protein